METVFSYYVGTLIYQNIFLMATVAQSSLYAPNASFSKHVLVLKTRAHGRYYESVSDISSIYQ